MKATTTVGMRDLEQEQIVTNKRVFEIPGPPDDLNAVQDTTGAVWKPVYDDQWSSFIDGTWRYKTWQELLSTRGPLNELESMPTVGDIMRAMPSHVGCGDDFLKRSYPKSWAKLEQLIELIQIHTRMQ